MPSQLGGFPCLGLGLLLALYSLLTHCRLGTYPLQAGLDEAVSQFRRYSGFRNADPVATESRIVLLTGARAGV